MRKKGLAIVILLVCQLLALSAKAGQEPYVNEMRGAKVKVDSSFTVSDEKFNTFTPTQWTNTILRKSVDDIVSFEINFDTSIYFFTTSFNCTASFKIYIYGDQTDTSKVTDSTTHANVSLNVTYNSVEGSKYKAIAFYKFKGAYKFRVKLLSISCPQLNPIPAIFRVKGQIIVNRQYEFIDNSTDVTRFTILDSSRLRLDWTPSNYPGAEQFDLEYTYIDSSSQIGASLRNYRFNIIDFKPPVDSMNKWFRNNNTRITTAASSYLMNIPYDSGYILFRIRGVQVTSDSNIRYEGNWNYLAIRGGTGTCSGSGCALGAVAFKGHQPSLNWQYSVVFAEEGKRKEVISYFDGSLRNRQSVTLSNSDNKNVVQETIYDALGRPALNILPAPTMDSTLHYFKNFNRNLSGNPYSFLDISYDGCNTTALKLDTSSGTGSYYSPGNDFLPIPTKYFNARFIPDAGGFPFALTEYMADNTGRIKAQSGVGDTFQLQFGHGTRYFYGKPTQTELDRLFGAEAGNASHYLKNMVMDANTQLSVSYVDASGKTVATALAGSSPSTLQSLPSEAGASVSVSNDLIAPGDFSRNASDNTLKATATFMVPVKGNYTFNYKLDPLKYEKLFGLNKDSVICSRCYYDLEIKVIDDCNVPKGSVTVNAGAIFDTTCNAGLDTLKGNFTINDLLIGEYYISYTLHIAEDAMKYFDSVHLVKNTDIKKLNYFLLDELKQTDFYSCYNNCQNCFAKLGTPSEFFNNFKQLYLTDSVNFSVADSIWVTQLYDSLLLNCQQIQVNCSSNNSVCDEKLDLLKRDISPGGQYALYDTSYVLQERPINRLDVNWRNRIVSFPDEFGNPDSVTLKTVLGDDSVRIPVKQLSDSLFITYWKDSWADSLVRLHPEYCFYLWCIANSSSYEFDREIDDWRDADTAIAKGWFNPSSYYALLDKDPFFTSPGGNAGRGVPFYAKMKKDLQFFSRKWMGYAVKDKNILQYIDVVIYCKDQYNAWTSCNPDSACRVRNREWELYKQLYLNLKQKYYNEARLTSTDTVFSKCVNCFVGKDILAEVSDCYVPPISDFSVSSPAGFVCGTGSGTIKYLQNATKPLSSKLTLKVAVYRHQGAVKDTVITNYSYAATADSLLYSYFCTTGKIIDSAKILNITCAAADTSFTPFTDSTTCNVNCPGGVYNPYDRDSVLFYVEYGNPNISPSGTPSGYGNCRFYPVFDLQKTATTSCRFFNVWVCTFDSTCSASFTCPTVSRFTTGLTTPLCNNGTTLSAYIRYTGPSIPPGVTVSVSVTYNGCNTNWNSPTVNFTNTSDSTITVCTPFSVNCGSVTKTINTPTCTGIPTPTGNCSVSGLPSSCPIVVGDDTLYRNKQRRYPEYINEDDVVKRFQKGNNNQGVAQATQSLITECKSNCEAQADYWISVLKNCVPDTLVLPALRAALIDICSKGCSLNTPNGTSSIPSTVAATYHSFEEAMATLVPTAVGTACSTELLANPYPYNRQPILEERLIIGTDYDICQRIASLRTEYLSSGFTGSWHGYLVKYYGRSYTLDSTELDELYKSCTQCSGLLNEDVILPPFMDPQSRPCIKCDSIQAALTGFNIKFPGLDTLNVNYEQLFANYFNHRFGFSLRYDDYRSFLDSCNAHANNYAYKLCNQAEVEDKVESDFSCTAQLFATALTNASSRYVTYIDSVRRDFKDAWLTRCLNAQAKLNLTANLYEYHYTLYYYDQSGSLVKTVPPEGVRFLDAVSLAQLKEQRETSTNACINNNSVKFTDGYLLYNGGATVSPQLDLADGPFTLEFWVNLSTYNDQGILSNLAYSAPNNKGYALGIINGRLNFLMGNNTGDKVEVQTSQLYGFIPLNKWAHVVVERTYGNEIQFLINGNQIPSSNIVSSSILINTTNNVRSFYIGKSFRNGVDSKLSAGSLKNLRIYKRALSVIEARQNFMNFCGDPSNANGLSFWETLAEGQWIINGGNNTVVDKIAVTTGTSNGTVAFEKLASNLLVPAHQLVTTYQYNSLNQVLQQYSPDGDTSVFFYDRLGRLIASQNREQKDNASYSGAAGRFSYTKYDGLGRIWEVGEKSSVIDIRNINLFSDGSVLNWLLLGTNKQITRTHYDNPINAYQSFGTSRKRVVASVYLENSTDTEGDSTLYVYDILGNVKSLFQHVKALVAVDATNGKKQIDYEYDLVSGKVNKVSYQEGKGDQFFYKYQFDADNRLTRAYTSRDKLYWIEDASYQYYLHGPLSRMELGQMKVQGVDYAYTLQGWLKGMNGMAANYDVDMGQDGHVFSPYGNKRVSQDAQSFQLDYYKGDYKPIGAVQIGNFTPFPGPQTQAAISASVKPLYNGNISGMGVNLSRLYSPVYNNYQYDQLNRLVAMDHYQGFDNVNNNWTPITLKQDYKERISYDANGNILKYLRNGVDDWRGKDMDSLSYKYNAGKNQLNYVKDAIGNTSNYSDIENQSANNYTYDKIGNLKTDVAEGLTGINWTVYGKIKQVAKTNVTIQYGYDPSGNRTFKTVTDAGVTTQTFYIRDAQGNTLSVYSKKGTDPLYWNEQHLYGSSRLGIFNWDTVVPATAPVVQINNQPVYDSLTIGKRVYELSNHLGNVLTIISDKKVGISWDGGITTVSYLPEVLSHNDYYPFGMMEMGRKFSVGNTYRYGFNGKENDNEVKGEGNQQDYGMRVYDVRLGKFMSIDPKQNNISFYSPYIFAGNKPVLAIDKDGEIEIIVNHILYASDGKTVLRKFSNRYIIETVEDLRGIEREPLNITVVSQMTLTSYQVGNVGYNYEIPENKYVEIGEGGESNEDRISKDFSGKVSKYVYKGMRKFWPPAKLNDAFVGSERDPITNELRHPSQMYLQAAEAVLDGITFGRAPFLKDGLKELTKSQLKKAIDWGAEEVIKYAVGKLGIDKEKSTVLGYYIIKYASEGATGKIKGLIKALETLVKSGTKGSEAINELKRMGYSLDMPKDKNDAVKEALKAEGVENVKINEKKN